MSRYTGPRVKKMRGLGINLPGLSAKRIDRRPYAPGQHGQSRRGKLSNYALQLREKQKIALNYGLNEKQLRRMLVEARSSSAPTGDVLAQLIERRLDNVVFRIGWALTIPAARQLVNHRHILVNGRTTDIASFRVSIGDKISLRERSQSNQGVLESLEHGRPYKPWYVEEGENDAWTVTGLPQLSDIPFPIDLQLVIEHYAKYL